MAMFAENESEELVSEINVTPLVDVMLVLLTVFIVTAPLLMNVVQVNLPKANAAVAVMEPKTIHIGVMDSGDVLLEQQKLALEALTSQLNVLKREDPAIEIYADEHAQYGIVAKVLAAIQQAGISKFSFVLAPESGK